MKQPLDTIIVTMIFWAVSNSDGAPESDDKIPVGQAPENFTNYYNYSDERLLEVMQTFIPSCPSSIRSMDNATLMANVRESMKEIEEASRKRPGNTFGVNCRSLMSRSDFERTLDIRSPDDRPLSGNLITPRAGSVVLPDNFDWRTKGVVTPVKDQGTCGSCWAFASTGALEGALKLLTGQLRSLSEQNLIDCAPKAKGCNGGWMTNAYDYVSSISGLAPTAAYPYKGVQGKCLLNSQTPKIQISIKNYQYTTRGDELELLRILVTIGPIAIAIDASEMQHYQSGIFRCSHVNLNHGVLLVGYGVDSNGRKYWIVKNSWGQSWGESGYIRIARDNNDSCGVAFNANYPVLVST